MATTTAKKAPVKKPAPKKPAAKKAPATTASKSKKPHTSAQLVSPVEQVPISQIAPSPLNPRKSFSEESIAELADNIFAQGQMQNISIRKVSGQAAPYHVIFGERRFRAMSLLVADGRWPKDATALARIIEADDATHLELAIQENERREDVHPLEQAEAYARLAALREAETGDAGSATLMIAERTGETRRNVQLYLQVSRNLIPEMKEAWTKGWIPTRKLALACARFTPDLQKEIIQALEWGDIRTEADLKEWLAETGYHSDAAIFELDDYVAAGGPSCEGPEGTGYQLLDKALFLKLQGAAIEKQAKALSKQHSLTCPPAKFTQWYYKQEGIKIVDGADPMPSDAYVLYGLDPNTAEAWIHIVSPTAEKTVKAKAAKVAAADGPTGPQPYARKNWMAGATVRTEHVRELIRRDGDRALAVAIVALLPGKGKLCNIRTDRPTGDAGEVHRALDGLMPDFFATLPGFEDEGRGIGIADAEIAVSALLALHHEELLDLFAHLIADQCVDMGWNAGPGCQPESRILTGLEPEQAELEGIADADWFRTYTSAQLRAIAGPAAAALRAPEDDPMPAKTAELSDWMARHRAPGWIPPEAQFLDEADMTRAVETLLKGAKS